MANQIYYTQFNVYPNPLKRIITVPKMIMPLFSNNAQVYYKNHSLAIGGTGTVRNAGVRSRRT
jgi:hypothetical protein